MNDKKLFLHWKVYQGLTHYQSFSFIHSPYFKKYFYLNIFLNSVFSFISSFIVSVFIEIIATSMMSTTNYYKNLSYAIITKPDNFNRLQTEFINEYENGPFNAHLFHLKRKNQEFKTLKNIAEHYSLYNKDDYSEYKKRILNKIKKRQDQAPAFMIKNISLILSNFSFFIFSMFYFYINHFSIVSLMGFILFSMSFNSMLNIAINGVLFLIYNYPRKNLSLSLNDSKSIGTFIKMFEDEGPANYPYLNILEDMIFSTLKKQTHLKEKINNLSRQETVKYVKLSEI